ncbi:hypothetical protein C7401_15222 [Paraburkholderia unamae]|uniref:hypothetical protein n=1 Tax=Paraburkholderia unamae TaxID=219649 RepID=UPI000DC3FD28|nr:hypothetical protein [Paraburkholderia unamae]RAR48270.1 hypothetical protein C7401_15222 [Paraburkholderia unamae]
MALNASSRLRPKVVAMQKRGFAVVLEYTEAAMANGTLPKQPARPIYRATLRVRARRTAESGQD